MMESVLTSGQLKKFSPVHKPGNSPVISGSIGAEAAGTKVSSNYKQLNNSRVL